MLGKCTYVHGIVVACATEGRQPSKKSNWFRGVGYRDVEMVAS